MKTRILNEKEFKKLINILKAFTDKKYFNYDIGFIFYNSERRELVATDTKRLMIVENIELDLEGEWFIDINNISNKLNNINKKEIKIINGFTFIKKDKDITFPNYINVIPTKDRMDKFSCDKLKVKDVIINIGSITGRPIFINFYKSFDKLNQETKVDIFVDRKENYFPVMYEWINEFDTNTKLIISPIRILD